MGSAKSGAIFLIYAVVLFALLAWWALGSTGVSGAFDLNNTAALKQELTAFGIAAVLTTLGILSKLVFDIVMPGGKAQGTTLNWRHGVAAMLVAPVIVFGLFEPLMRMESTVLAALFCYQNGFFFQTVLGKKQ